MENLKHKKRNIPLIIAIILFLLVAISVSFLGGLYASFSGEDSTNNVARVASFKITGDGYSQKINLEINMNPGDRQTVVLDVQNDGEVSVRYTLSIVNATKNLPLKLFDGTNYHNLNSEFSFSDTLSPNSNVITHNLTIVWDETDNNFEYCGMVDNLVLTVTAVQID